MPEWQRQGAAARVVRRQGSPQSRAIGVDLAFQAAAGEAGWAVDWQPKMLARRDVGLTSLKVPRLNAPTILGCTHAKSSGGINEIAFMDRARRGGAHRLRRHRPRPATHRHQVQPRRRPGYAQGQGRRILQEARRGAHQGSRQGRGVSEQPAVQGWRGNGGAAARFGADARAVRGEIRPLGRARVRGLRSAVHLRQFRRAAQSNRRSGRREFVQEARDQGHHRARLLGQRLQGLSARTRRSKVRATSRA